MKGSLIYLIACLGIGIFLIAACQSKPTGPRRFQPAPTSEELAERLGLFDDERPVESRYLERSDQYLPADITVTDLAGRSRNLSVFQGKWMLLDFFTTYAMPSQYQMPKYNELFLRYKEKGFVVVGVSLDMQGRVMVEPFLETLDISYPVFLASGETLKGATPYGFIKEIPVSLLINPKGKMVNGYLGTVEISTIEKDIKSALR